MISPSTKLGHNIEIQEFATIGIHPDPTHLTSIADNAKIRSHTVIYSGNIIGIDFQTGHFTLIRENNRIGDNVSIGSHTVLEHSNIIGDNVRIHSNCFIPEFVTIGDNVWIGPNVTILNTLHPPCPNFENCAKGIFISDNVVIGGNTTIGPHVTIGKNSFIGMGSIVTKSIPENVVAYGNPAKVVKKIEELRCIGNKGMKIMMIGDIKEKLKNFEKEYDMSSEVFYHEYKKGEMHGYDYMVWASYYERYLEECE